MTTTSYDSLALAALLDSNKGRGEQTLARLTTHARGEHECQNCRSTGPHEVQSSMGELEFSCSSCGMMHVVPAP